MLTFSFQSQVDDSLNKIFASVLFQTFKLFRDRLRHSRKGKERDALIDIYTSMEEIVISHISTLSTRRVEDLFLLELKSDGEKTVDEYMGLLRMRMLGRERRKDRETLGRKERKGKRERLLFSECVDGDLFDFQNEWYSKKCMDYTHTHTHTHTHTLQ